MWVVSCSSFQSSLPSLGEGALKPRENPRMLGTDKEHTLLNAEDPWYKNNSIDFSRLQVAIDTFLFAREYTDLATLAVLSKYTAGDTYYYPSFYAKRDGAKFEHELKHDLTRATGFEAVMRVRATRGMRITNFYGNYFIRGSDLLALPNVTSNTTFSFDLAYEETSLSAQAITVQAALLYTSSNGERRIRIHTILLPVTQSIPEVVDSVDIDCVVNVLTKQAVDIAQKTGFDNARQRVHQLTVDLLRGCKSGPAPGSGPGAMYQQQQSGEVPLSLQLLPLYSMSIQKSLVIRGGGEVRIDERAFYQQLALNMNIDESKVFIYPRMFSLHDLAEDAGLAATPEEAEEIPVAGPNRIRLPTILNLTHERLTSDGLFLLENGFDLLLWVGRSLNPAFLNTLFGLSSLDGVDTSSLEIHAENSDYSSRVFAIIQALRTDRSRYMHMHVVREGDGPAEAYFARYLVEDRAHYPGGAMSYMEYHGHVTRQAAGMPG